MEVLATPRALHTPWLFVVEPERRMGDAFVRQFRRQMESRGHTVRDEQGAAFLTLATTLKRPRKGPLVHRPHGEAAKTFSPQFLAAAQTVFWACIAPGQSWAPRAQLRLEGAIGARGLVATRVRGDAPGTSLPESLIVARQQLSGVYMAEALQVLEAAPDGSPLLQATLERIGQLEYEGGRVDTKKMAPRACARFAAAFKTSMRKTEGARQVAKAAASYEDCVKVIKEKGRGCEVITQEIADFLFEMRGQVDAAKRLGYRPPRITEFLERFASSQKAREKLHSPLGLIDVAVHFAELLAHICAHPFAPPLHTISSQQSINFPLCKRERKANGNKGIDRYLTCRVGQGVRRTRIGVPGLLAAG